MTDWNALADKTPRYAVGLMSGTSCDGIDAALVRLKGTGPSLVIKLIAHETFEYPSSLRARLLSEGMHAKEVCRLNFELGERMAGAVKAVIAEAKNEEVEVDFISSHGHTIAHYPPGSHDRVGTLQIGEAAVIAERTGLPVVSDFRPRDIAAGGQGAPLVPYADWVLFHKLKHRVGCLNIGGIANLTVVTPELENVMAFDTGPGNMIIDGAARFLSKGMKQMDEDGRAAKRGMVIQEFLDYLLSHPYLARVPPKSTGREEFGVNVYLRDALASRTEHAYEDLMATVTEAVSRSIVAAYNRFVEPLHPLEHIIVGGGGAENKTLMRSLKEGLPEVRFFVSDDYGIPQSAREAVSFAILGNETICGTPNNIPHATGAKRSLVLGRLTPA